MATDSSLHLNRMPMLLLAKLSGPFARQLFKEIPCYTWLELKTILMGVLFDFGLATAR